MKLLDPHFYIDTKGINLIQITNVNYLAMKVASTCLLIYLKLYTMNQHFSL